MIYSVGNGGGQVTDDTDRCPKHDRKWKMGNWGGYCTAKDDTTEKGYCELKATKAWNARHEQ